MSSLFPSRSEGSSEAAPLSIGLGRLSIEDVVRVARNRQRVSPLASEVETRVSASAAWVADRVEQITQARQNGQQPPAYYGINTGFGALAGRTALDNN